MRRFIVGVSLTVMTLSVLITGCGKKNEEPQVEVVTEVILSNEVKDAMEELHSIAVNYSNGIAPLNIIPVPTVELIYDNWDAIEASDDANAPISLREYVEPSIVYLDYDVDYSIKWFKDSGDVQVQKTDIADREDYRQKAHK